MLYHHCSSTLLKNMPLEKFKVNRVELKLNGTHQFLAYADDVILLEDNISNIKKKHGSFN
jgi:hypothetical protein